jgi:hypothetical protein
MRVKLGVVLSSAAMAALIAPAATAAAGTTGASPRVGSTACSVPVLVKNLGAHWTVIGASYAENVKKVKRSFFYGKGQPTALSVGILDEGVFRDDGTKTVRAAESETFTSSGDGNDLYQTRFEFAEFKTVCTSSVAAAAHPRAESVTEYLLEPTGSLGDQRTETVKTAPPALHCIPMSSGEDFTLNDTAAPVFSEAFSLKGFQGSSQTGYSKKASITFRFGQAGQLCGTESSGGEPRGLLEAK